MTPQAIFDPEFPETFDNSAPPLPRSSTPE
jgi:hypothetical protein